MYLVTQFALPIPPPLTKGEAGLTNVLEYIYFQKREKYEGIRSGLYR